jgi:membrane protease YdiL (CAAX protease family)
MSLLRSWWFYLCLVALTGTLYASPHFREALQPPEPAPAPDAALQTMPELELTRVIEQVAQQPTAAILLSLWIFLGACLFLGGLVLGARELLARRAGRRPRQPAGRVPFLWPLGQALRLLILLGVVVLLMPFVHVLAVTRGVSWAGNTRVWSLAAMFVIHGLLLLFIWGFASMNGLRVSQMFGITRAKARRAIVEGLKGYAIAVPWIFGLLALVATLAERVGIKPSVETIHELIFLEHGAWVMVLTVLLACVMGPVAEEIIFRGVLYSTLRRRCSRGMAMLISGSVFAAVHTNLIGFAPIVALGALLAGRYERTGSLLAPIAIHVVHNALLMGLALTLKEFL